MWLNSPKTGHLTTKIASKPDKQVCSNKIKLTVLNKDFSNCNFDINVDITELAI